MKEYFLIAKITGIGKNGFLKIKSYSDFPERFYNLKTVYIDFFDDKKLFTVEKVINQKNTFLIKFKNFNSEEECMVLLGKEIFVDSKDSIRLPDDHYFIHDLIGSRVYKNETEIGIVKDVWNMPANDVYVIEDNSGKELLIPAVKEFIENFDAEKKILTLKPGEDFYEDDED